MGKFLQLSVHDMIMAGYNHFNFLFMCFISFKALCGENYGVDGVLILVMLNPDMPCLLKKPTDLDLHCLSFSM